MSALRSIFRANRFPFWGLLCGMLGLLSGCADDQRIVVYADPWLGEYAERLRAEYEAVHPETEVQLKVLSTEVIAQHLHFGQPIDIALCYGSELIADPAFRANIQQESTLAASCIVIAHVKDSQSPNITTMRTIKSIMIEASDRPSRRYADELPPDSALSARLIANFQSQAQDYLLRAWVPAGYVPIHFVRAHAAQFNEGTRGPLIPNAFTAATFRNAPNPGLAAEFLAFTHSEKSKQILAQLKFLP